MSIIIPHYENLNYDEMAKKIGLKVAYMPMLIESFLEESIPTLENLRESITSRDYASIKSQAHSIKGSAGNLRLDEIYEMAKEMELSATAHKIDFEYEDYRNAINQAILTIPA